MRRLSREALAIAIVLAVAAAVRFWGLGFGLPNRFYHPDEFYNYISQAIELSRNPIPFDFINPPLFKYLLLAEYGLLFLVGKALGWFSSFGFFFLETPDPFFLLARATSAALGVATVGTLYVTGCTLYSRRVGAMAAAFLALSYLHVRDSHYGANDVATTFFATLTILFSARVLVKGQTRDYVVAGLAGGMAAATKYTGGLALVALLLAHWLRWHSHKDTLHRRAVMGLSAAGAAFALFMLGAIFNLEALLFSLGLLANWAQLGVLNLMGSEEISPGWGFYWWTLTWGIGEWLAIVSLAGLAIGLVRRRPADLIVASAVLLPYLFLAPQKLIYSRFILPAIPPLLLLAAVAVNDIARAVSGNRRRLEGGLVLALALLLLTQPAAQDLRFAYLLGQPDTRSIARQWMDENIPAGSVVAVEPLGPQFWTAYGFESWVGWEREPIYDAAFQPMRLSLAGLLGGDYTVDGLRQQGAEFLVVNSWQYGIEIPDSTLQTRRDAFYSSLDRDGQLLLVVSPYQGDLPLYEYSLEPTYGPTTDLWIREHLGPVVKIYRLADKADHISQ